MKPFPNRPSACFGVVLALLWPARQPGAAGDSGNSAVAEINADNVGQLSLAFSVKLPSGAGYAATPQLAGDTLFV